MKIVGVLGLLLCAACPNQSLNDSKTALANGIAFRLARVKPSIAEVLSRDGVIALLGADHIHSDVQAAVTAQQTAEDHGAG